MICHFRRHLPKGDAKTWLAEVPEYGGTRMRTTKGDDETPLSSAPSERGREDMAGRSTCGRRRSTAFQYSPFLQAVPWPIPSPQSIPFPHWQRFPRFAAVAAGPSRRNPPGRHLWYGFLIRSLSTLAAYPAIRCRCGKRSYLIVPNCHDGGQVYQAQCISTHFIGIYCHFALSSMKHEILCLLTKLIL